MRYCWLAAGLLVLALPLIASALPRLVTIPVARTVGAIDITFRIEGVSAAEQVAGANFEIPTDVRGYEVIGGQILTPDQASPDWVAQFNPTASFRSSENDFFLSFFSCRRIDSESCDFQFLVELGEFEPRTLVGEFCEWRGAPHRHDAGGLGHMR